MYYYTDLLYDYGVSIQYNFHSISSLLLYSMCVRALSVCAYYHTKIVNVTIIRPVCDALSFFLSRVRRELNIYALDFGPN